MKRTLIAAALAATIAVPAFAASDTFRMDINYTRANLETPAGAAAEYDQIRKQVTARCAAEHASLKIFPAQVERICTAGLMDKAVRQISHPLLSEVHTSRR